MGRKHIWDTGGGGHCRKHKFHCGIVFEGEETFVTPLATTVAVVATLWPPAVSENVTGIFFTEKKPCDTLVCGF